MMWTLESLLEHCRTVCRETHPGRYVSARPEGCPLVWRFRSAWEVLRGRADAFTWPDGQ